MIASFSPGDVWSRLCNNYFQNKANKIMIMKLFLTFTAFRAEIFFLSVYKISLIAVKVVYEKFLFTSPP